jgi:hypothetical protein
MAFADGLGSGIMVGNSHDSPSCSQLSARAVTPQAAPTRSMRHAACYKAVMGKRSFARSARTCVPTCQRDTQATGSSCIGPQTKDSKMSQPTGRVCAREKGLAVSVQACRCDVKVCQQVGLTQEQAVPLPVPPSSHTRRALQPFSFGPSRPVTQSLQAVQVFKNIEPHQVNEFS